MKTTIDHAGRLVIPKALREQAGLKAGMELDVNFRDGGIEITVPEAKGCLVREGGLLVWEPAPGTPLVSGEEINELIRVLREEPDKF